MKQYENPTLRWIVEEYNDIIANADKKFIFIENKRTGFSKSFSDISYDGEWLSVELSSYDTEQMVGDNNFETWWEIDGKSFRDEGGTIHVDKSLHNPREEGFGDGDNSN